MCRQTIATRSTWLFMTVAVLASACVPEDAVPEPDARNVTAQVPPAQLERAREAANALGQELQSMLLSTLEQDGPLGAIEVCAVEAQEISGRHSDDEVVARRTSLLTRNPINDPDPYEAERLSALAAAHERGELPQEDVEVRTENGERVLRYLRPIVVAQPCLACHGAPGQTDPSVIELIQAQYPEDRAIGYETGDFRGAVSVRVRLGDAVAP